MQNNYNQQPPAAASATGGSFAGNSGHTAGNGDGAAGMPVGGFSQGEVPYGGEDSGVLVPFTGPAQPDNGETAGGRLGQIYDPAPGVALGGFGAGGRELVLADGQQGTFLPPGQTRYHGWQRGSSASQLSAIPATLWNNNVVANSPVMSILSIREVHALAL